MTKKNARRTFLSLTGISLAGFIALLGTNLGPIVEAIGGLPKVLMAFSTALPMGTKMFFLVFAITCFSWARAMRWRTHDISADTVALLIAPALTIALNLVSPPAGPRAASLLQAIMLGLLAGFAAPYVAKLACLLGRWAYTAFVGEEDDTDQAGA